MKESDHSANQNTGKNPGGDLSGARQATHDLWAEIPRNDKNQNTVNRGLKSFGGEAAGEDKKDRLESHRIIPRSHKIRHEGY